MRIVSNQMPRPATLATWCRVSVMRSSAESRSQSGVPYRLRRDGELAGRERCLPIDLRAIDAYLAHIEADPNLYRFVGHQPAAAPLWDLAACPGVKVHGSSGRMNVRSYRRTQPLSSRMRSAAMKSRCTPKSPRYCS